LARFGLVELLARLLAADRELQGVGVAVGDVGPALAQALAPGGEVDLVDLAHLHVDAALADATAADAGEIGLAADFEREAAVHDVIPAVPLRHALGVHGTDEITQALGGGHENLLRADAAQFRHHQVRQLVPHAVDAGDQL